MTVLNTEYLSNFEAISEGLRALIVFGLFFLVTAAISVVIIVATKLDKFVFIMGFTVFVGIIVCIVIDPFDWRETSQYVDYREVIFDGEFKESEDYLELMRTYEVSEIKGDIWVLKPREMMEDPE